MNQVHRPENLQWIETEFSMVGAFSLRPSNTTANSGRTLLLPTPYAVKMGLLDQLISWRGLDFALGYFSQVRNLMIWIDPPELITVSQVTRHIYRWDDEIYTWKGNLLNQQYCFYSNTIRFCFGSADKNFMEILTQFVPALEYLGQRGGFIQNLGIITITDSPKESFIDLQMATDIRKLNPGIVQRMDDMLPTITFNDISRFASGKTEAVTRRQYDILLPYHLRKSSASYALYERNH